MKKLVCVVISDKMVKSSVVVVERQWRHTLYKKTVTRSKKYLVRNDVKAAIGDNVVITETRPLSKQIRFIITEIVKKI